MPKQSNDLLQAQAIQTNQETQESMTQTDINYSVKIGKQVIKSKLREAKSKYEKQYNNISNELHKIINYDDTKKMLRKELKTRINADTNTTALRSIWNKFHTKKIRTNWGLVSADNCSRVAGVIARPNNYAHESYQKMIKTKIVIIEYHMHIGMRDLDDIHRDEDGTEEVDCGWTLEVDIPSKLLPDMSIMLQKLKPLKKLRDLIKEIDYKLKNIGDTMENMEAKLLTQELNRSPRGKEVLDLTSSVIADVIGEDINLALENIT